MRVVLNEKLFFLDNDREVNKLVFRIGGIFMIVLVGILGAAYFDVFKVEPVNVLYIMGLLLITETIFFILLKAKVPVGFVKYYGLLAMEFCVTMMISNAYFGIYITYILVPVISLLYFDKKFTRNIVIICYVCMLVALWFRAPGAIELAYPGYTRASWFFAFGLGYTFEYVAVSAATIAVARRSRNYMQELYHRNERIRDIQSKTISRFADLVESRDDNTGKHIKRAGRYVMLIGERLSRENEYAEALDREALINLELAAPLHDIGKIVISDVILQKPGKLTSEEFEIIKTHTTEGQKIIDSSMEGIESETFLGIARDIALSHHEKWNGTGYPNGLSGEDIPLVARIMAVADVFDALISDRCYKKAVSVEEALSVIRDGSGKHFDPHIVEVFLSAEEEIRRIVKE